MKSREQCQAQVRDWANQFANKHDINVFDVRSKATQELAWYVRDKTLNEQCITTRALKYAMFLEKDYLSKDQKIDLLVRKSVLLWLFEEEAA